MIRPSHWSTAIVLALSLLGSAAVAAAEPAPEQPESEDQQAAAEPEQEDTTASDEEQADDEQSPFDYQSSEEISEDRSVSFPVDI